MQRKTFNRTALGLVAAIALFPLAVQAQAVKLTLGHGAAVGNPRHEAAVKFAEVAKAKSGGRIEVQIAPSAQLGDDAAMVTALRTGALDMSANSQGAVANAVPEYAAYGMPFLFSSPAQAFKLLDGPLGKELADKSAEKGLIVLGYWDNGIRQMTNSKRPITKVEDMKGLKMRIPTRTGAWIIEALGAAPAAMPRRMPLPSSPSAPTRNLQRRASGTCAASIVSRIFIGWPRKNGPKRSSVDPARRAASATNGARDLKPSLGRILATARVAIRFASLIV